MIRVQFFYSSSPNYEKAVALAQAADEYTLSGEGRNITHEAGYRFENFPKAKKLVMLVKGWKTASLSSCGAELELRKVYTLEGVYFCWRQAAECEDPEPYCRQAEGRLRLPIDEMQRSLMICRMCKIVHRGFRWDAYGWLAPDGMFVIDKQRLRQLAERDLEYKRMDCCPLFEWSRVEAAIEELPDIVDPETIRRRRVPDIIISPAGIEIPCLEKREALPGNVIDIEEFRARWSGR